MKRYNIYSLALALCIGAVSCQKDFDETLVDGATQGGTQITFTVEPSSTRVDVDGLAVTWSEGDQVMFFNTGSGSVVDGDCLTAEINSNYSNIASFSGTVTPSSGKLLGFYPASGAHINNGNQYLSSMLRLVQPLYLELSYDAEGEITPSSLAPYCYMLVKSNEELSSTSANNLTGSMEHLMAYVDLDLNIPSGKKLERVFIALTSTTTTLPVQSMKISAADGSVTYDDYVDNMTTVDTGAAWHLMDYMVLELTGSDGNLGTSVNADGVVPVRIPFIPQALADTWTIFATYTDGTESIQKSEINNTLEAGKVYTREIDLQTTSGAATTPKLGDYYYSDGTYSTNLDASKTVDGLVTRLYVNGVDTNISQVASPYAKYSTFMEDAYTSSYTQWNPLATGNAASGQNASVADIITTVARIKTLVDADNAYYAEINMDMTYLEILEKVFPDSHAFAFALNSNTADGSPDYTTYSPNGTTLASDDENIWHLGSIQDYMAMANDVAMLQGGKGKNYLFKQEAGYPASVKSNENFVTLFPLDSDGNDTYDRVTLYAGKQTNTGKTDAIYETIMALETTIDSGRKYGSSSINNTGKPTCTYANTYYKANSLGSYIRSSGSVIYTTVTGQQVTHLYPTLEKLYFRPIKRVNYAKSEGSGSTYNPTVSVSIDNAPSTIVIGDDIDLTASSSTNDGAEVTYVWSLGDGDTAYATLEGNKLTATAEGTITLTVTATAGSAVDSESIEITILTADIPVYVAPEVGDYYYADYTWSAPSELEAHKAANETTVIGVIYYLNETTGMALVASINAPLLASESNGYAWGKSATDDTPNYCIASGSTLLGTSQSKTGVENMQIVKEAEATINTTAEISEYNTFDGYPAFQAIHDLNTKNFGSEVDYETCGDENIWYMPLLADAQKFYVWMYNNSDDPANSTYTVTNLNKLFDDGGRENSTYCKFYTLSTDKRSWTTAESYGNNIPKSTYVGTKTTSPYYNSTGIAKYNTNIMMGTLPVLTFKYMDVE